MIPKYRAWKKAGKELGRVGQITFELDGSVSHVLFKGKFLDFNVPINEIILMQSTGLLDKYGKEIFEGDIVRTTRFLGRADEIGGFYEYEKDYVGVVKVLEGSWVIDTGIVAVRLWSEIDESEVLGNIYENPELLEDKE